MSRRLSRASSPRRGGIVSDASGHPSISTTGDRSPGARFRSQIIRHQHPMSRRAGTSAWITRAGIASRCHPGSATVVPRCVSTVFLVGDIYLAPSQLRFSDRPARRADGILGTDGMSGRRIQIDFRHDLITIQRSHNERAKPAFVPFRSNWYKAICCRSTPRWAVFAPGPSSTPAASRRLPTWRCARHWSGDRHRSPVGPIRSRAVTTDVQEGDAAHTPPLIIFASDRGSVVEIRYHDVHLWRHAYIRALAPDARAGDV